MRDRRDDPIFTADREVRKEYVNGYRMSITEKAYEASHIIRVTHGRAVKIKMEHPGTWRRVMEKYEELKEQVKKCDPAIHKYAIGAKAKKALSAEFGGADLKQHEQFSIFEYGVVYIDSREGRHYLYKEGASGEYDYLHSFPQKKVLVEWLKEKANLEKLEHINKGE